MEPKSISVVADNESDRQSAEKSIQYCQKASAKVARLAVGLIVREKKTTSKTNTKKTKRKQRKQTKQTETKR